jgi:uncharacterized protein (DUF885 family)
MRRFIAILLASAVVSSATPPTMLAAATQADAGAAFRALSARYIDTVARLSPIGATQLGDHRFDDKLPDLSAAGRAKQIAADKAMLADLAAIDRKALSRDDQVDAAVLDNALRYEIWDTETVQSWAWNAQIYNDTAAGALYTLAARDFAPWPQRLKAATARMEALPALIAQGRSELVPARVPAIYATTVSKQNAGIMEVADGMLEPHANELAAADRARFDAALAGLKAAVAGQQHWIDTVLVPQAKGDFRLGAKLYDEKMRFALMSDMTRADLKQRAVAALADTRMQMYAIARTVLAGKPGAPTMPDHPTADQQQAAIEAALALAYAQRPARGELEEKGRAALVQATAFVRAKDLVSMPEGPVRIITMPKFQQGNAVAYCDPPGPLDRGQQTFVAISPIPDDWSDAQATSFLSEYNDYMVQDLIVHEAMPGHYLQLDHANRNPSTLRAVLFSSPFAEGWAVYAEGMMADQGYLGGDPLFRLTVLKMRLRSIANTLLDIGIHTGGMTREQAMTLMTRSAFQQEREAAGKWVRASLSSAQLLSYFTGYSEHMAMRGEAQRRWGAGFALKRYNDAVLAHGSPPTRFVRELLFDLPIG